MNPIAASTSSSEPLKVYWQPGCTGCLRMKEFLTKNGVEFISVNVLAVLAPAAMIALLTIGINLTGDGIARSLGRSYVPRTSRTVIE